MQLYILGKNSDDKGSQLEQLTVKILEHQGLEDITQIYRVQEVMR